MCVCVCVCVCLCVCVFVCVCVCVCTVCYLEPRVLGMMLSLGSDFLVVYVDLRLVKVIFLVSVHVHVYVKFKELMTVLINRHVSTLR